MSLIEQQQQCKLFLDDLDKNRAVAVRQDLVTTDGAAEEEEEEDGDHATETEGKDTKEKKKETTGKSTKTARTSKKRAAVTAIDGITSMVGLVVEVEPCTVCTLVILITEHLSSGHARLPQAHKTLPRLHTMARHYAPPATRPHRCRSRAYCVLCADGSDFRVTVRSGEGGGGGSRGVG